MQDSTQVMFMTIDEAADALNCSPVTAARHACQALGMQLKTHVYTIVQHAGTRPELGLRVAI